MQRTERKKKNNSASEKCRTSINAPKYKEYE